MFVVIASLVAFLAATGSNATLQSQIQELKSELQVAHTSQSPRPTDAKTHSLGVPSTELGACLEVGWRETRKTPIEDRECLRHTEPSPYVRLVAAVVVGLPSQGTCGGEGCSSVLAYREEERKFGNDWPPHGFTMIGKARVANFRAAIEEVNRNGIAGAIVETGVWRGGACMFAAAVTRESSMPQRQIYLFDAFEAIGNYGEATAHFLDTSEKAVRDGFEALGLMGENIHFRKGLFKDTVPAWDAGQIAVLRVDGNFYDSYQDALYYMYPHVPVGGIIIFDDVFSHAPVMRAWEDFKKDQGLGEELNRIDLHSAWFRKVKDVKVDAALMHAPVDVNK